MDYIMRISKAFFCLIIFSAILGFSYRTGKANHQIDDEHLTFIFDLGEVILTTDRMKTVGQLGFYNLFSYWRNKTKESKAIKDTFYQTLDNIAGIQGNQYGAKDDEGKLLPQLMCEWLRGTITTAELKERVVSEVDSHPDWFLSKAEQRLMNKMATMIFTPTAFIQTRKLIKETINLVKEYKARGHKVYILSNWDRESFALLVDKYPDIFSLFDGLLISGYLEDLKPNQSIFSHFTSKFRAERCVLIDDQLENVEAARACGIHGIQFAKGPKNIKKSISQIKTKIALLEKQYCNRYSCPTTKRFQTQQTTN